MKTKRKVRQTEAQKIGVSNINIGISIVADLIHETNRLNKFDF